MASSFASVTRPKSYIELERYSTDEGVDCLTNYLSETELNLERPPPPLPPPRSSSMYNSPTSVAGNRKRRSAAVWFTATVLGTALLLSCILVICTNAYYLLKVWHSLGELRVLADCLGCYTKHTNERNRVVKGPNDPL